MVDRLVNSEANTRRIASVESCFGSSGVPLAMQGRVLVGEGVLTKMCRKRPKSRQFFLFNDILVYGNIVIGKKKYNKQHIMPLEEVSLESIADNQAYRNGWYIRTTTKSFVVFAATSTEKQEWMAHINKCVEDLLRKSGKKPVENHAAVWVPDTEASVCMHCKRTQFTFIQRRHHCRNCGAVVCAGCSSKKFLLPQQSTKALRVCDACYERLKQVPSSEDSGASAAAAAGGNKLNTTAGDSSNDEDSDEETASPGGESHDEPRFYGDNSVLSAADDSSTIASPSSATSEAPPGVQGVQSTPAAVATMGSNC
ncbi:pleckstrin homology domain-containing family F member 1 homolog [Drosophila takahashii]|uniref:pleckstrin homology domain-containing family F member 1 homolog n=1 Tax=Drosophila takahashii TaxID=29030 RepID=UPI001CF925AB|nr:pleckstrin homology domain-containing family F member 1 homolog [Drosophila takahashii]XP_044249137.1 pleckstrin homology domain-containing family F member 1 homolog [Drosophila takahashii]